MSEEINQIGEEQRDNRCQFENELLDALSKKDEHGQSLLLAIEPLS